jgi:hypothetical protein
MSRIKKWKPVTDEVLAKFDDELNELAKRTFGVNEDGECPITVGVLDRSRYQYQHWVPVPYHFRAKTTKAKREVRDAVALNLLSATEEFNQWIKMEWFTERHEKKK